MFETVQQRKVALLLGLFIFALSAVNLLGTKITTIFGISVSVGIFAYPLTFMITDIVGEVYGKKVSRQFLFIGVISLIVLFAYTALAVALPPAARFADQAAYETIFSNSLRFIAASIIAFAVSQAHDIITFAALKKRTEGKLLWFRNNLSTFLSQGIDTFLFMFIAFYNTSPRMTAGFVTELALTYWGLKILFAFIDTPLVYAGVRWLRAGMKEESTAAKAE